MNNWKKITLSILLLLLPVSAQVTQKSPEPAKRPALYLIQSGDLNGDGKSEVITWDSADKEMAVSDYVSGQLKKLTSHPLTAFPTNIKIADLDGDGRGELLIGEGLPGYNPKTGPQTDLRLRIYEPLEKGGWTPVEIFRQASTRPDFTSIEVLDLDGDKQPEILFSYFAEKYVVNIRIARRVGDSWKIEELPSVQMGMHVAAGDVMHNGKKMIVVGRPYGEEVRSTGGAFVLDGEKRIDLPAFRGVSSLAVGDVDGDGRAEIVVGDGWHFDYGKLARARLAIIKYAKGKWNYQFVEDVPEHISIRNIKLADIDGDGKVEIIAQGQRRDSLVGDVRIYQRTASGWRAKTISNDVQEFAVGSFTGNKKNELIFSEEQPQLLALNLRTIKWDPELAEAVETYEIDPATLLGKPAPPLTVEEWVGKPSLSFEKLKGKVVLLDFWATWCKPCIAAFPTLKQWQAKYGSQGFVIIGMTNHSSQTSEDIRSFLQKNPLPWTVAIDPSSRTHMDYGVNPLPHAVLIDRTGKVRLSHNGGGEEGLLEVENQIKVLLSEN